MTISSLHARRTAVQEGLPDTQAHHRLGQGSAFVEGESFLETVLYHFLFHSHVQSRIMLPLGILSSKPEGYKSDVDHRRVAPSAIFTGN